MAPRATTKKPKALIFEAADRKAVCTSVEEGVGCCADEEQVTSNSATYRATPIVAVAVSALIVEQTTDATTATSRRKLKGRVIGVGIVVPSTKAVCSCPLCIGRHVVTHRARPLVSSSPTVVVVVALLKLHKIFLFSFILVIFSLNF